MSAHSLPLSSGVLEELLSRTETETLEFKAARQDFDTNKLMKYCAALANERGGLLIPGVSDRYPRRVVGTQAFRDLGKIKSLVLQRLQFRVEAQELVHTDGRVVAFRIPSRPVGMPIQLDGSFWMRSGEELVAMTPDQLKAIFDEAGPDFTAEVCRGATLDDLDELAIAKLRRLVRSKSPNAFDENASSEEILVATDLLTERGLTYAGLILLGSAQGLSAYLPAAEVLYEYRSAESSIPFARREELRSALLVLLDELWDFVSARNEVQQIRDGLVAYNLPTFNEVVVREALLNAVAHRDYRLGNSVFVKQWPRSLEVTSPGPFPPGITAENIVSRQFPRNRRLAEALGRCGLVERSGQGADQMFSTSIREGKSPPDYSGSDSHQVQLVLRGQVQDPAFVRFLEAAAQETGVGLSVHDLVVLDAIRSEHKVPLSHRSRLPVLETLGAIECVGRGRSKRYILSRRLYGVLGKRGAYTRKKGLDRETNKTLLLHHLKDSGLDGAQLDELVQVLPDLTRD